MTMRRWWYFARVWFVLAAFAAALVTAAGIYGQTGPRTATPGRASRVGSTNSAFREVNPEAVGFSSQRLERLHAVIERAVDQKQFAGAVTILARHGEIVDFKVFGKQDLATGTPMREDTIFRIFSMSKPITSTAMMILYEEGKWDPEDPISKYIPAFADLKVFKGVDSNGRMLVEKPVSPPTMRELMTHTAGFTYGFGDDPVDRMYRAKGVLHSASLGQMVDKLATIPLLYQPGTRWVYSISVDIQGYIVEKLSGESLPDFMRDRIFKPLGMQDTGFYVPPEKRKRFASLYQWNPSKGLVPGSAESLGVSYSKEEPAMPSGGGGLVSTAGDYLRFAEMLLDGGELDGVRILGPETVKMMTANHLPASLMGTENGMRFWGILRPGFGYGYDFGVFTNPGLADAPVGKGTFMWDGAAGTWFWVDPANDIVFVGMVQRLGGGPFTGGLQELARATVYQALIDPAK